MYCTVYCCCYLTFTNFQYICLFLCSFCCCIFSCFILLCTLISVWPATSLHILLLIMPFSYHFMCLPEAWIDSINETKRNASKYMCLAIGKLAKLLIEPMFSGANLIEWVISIKYLGVTITGGNSLGLNNGPVKQSFTPAGNGLLCPLLVSNRRTLR